MASLLSIPLELRLIIYDEFFDKSMPAIVQKLYEPMDPNYHAIALTCQQLYHETQPWINNSRPIMVHSRESDNLSLFLRPWHPFFTKGAEQNQGKSRGATTMAWKGRYWEDTCDFHINDTSPQLMVLQVDEMDASPLARMFQSLMSTEHLWDDPRHRISVGLAHLLKFFPGLPEVHIAWVATTPPKLSFEGMFPKWIFSCHPSLEKVFLEYEGFLREERDTSGMIVLLKLLDWDDQEVWSTKLSYGYYQRTETRIQAVPFPKC